MESGPAKPPGRAAITLVIQQGQHEEDETALHDKSTG
jgi:hypothetical protein